jgi:hypothetical protein
MKINHWAEDVFEMKSAKRKGLPRCDYCGGDREIALLSTIGAQRLCESCATLSLEERKEVKKFQAQKEAVDQMSIDEIWEARQEFIEKNKDQKRMVPCPDPKYEGSLWEYCGEGFRVHWDGHQWNARCTNPCAIYISIFEDVDPVAMEVEGFWNIIEYGGCISTHEKPKPLRRNPNKAPEIKVPWDPFW